MKEDLHCVRARGGEALAACLLERDLSDARVGLALLRAGVPVALAVARRFNAPLDILTVRKIGLPDNPEHAIGAAAVVVAAPVASAQAVEPLEPIADAVVTLLVPPSLQPVGEWYQQFDQLTDEETVSLLEAAARHTRPQPSQPSMSRSAV